MPPPPQSAFARPPDGSGWARLPLGAPLSAPVLAEILDGGQAFRWWRQPDGSWLGTFGAEQVELKTDTQGGIDWRTPGATTAVAVGRYFDVDRDPRELTDALPWRSDPHLARCLAAFPGLRILRQPFGETLLAFLCSATKQIVQIKQMLALLARRHGRTLAGAVATGTAVWGPGPTGALSFALPTWAELARLSEADLRGCQLGFRARYIHQTARFLDAHPGWLEETEMLPYAEAKERLGALPGVGEKVADCVLLFGAGRLEAFPVDVWILRTMAARYGLRGWRPAQLAQFGRVHFGPLAGLAQQFLFAYERAAARHRTSLAVAAADPKSTR